MDTNSSESTDSIVRGLSAVSIGSSSNSTTNNSTPDVGLRALVVDESITSLHHSLDMLKKYHYIVTGVGGGSKALEMLRNKPGCFDLVVTELHMRDMDGFALIQSIREEFPTVAVFLASGDKRPKMVKKGIMKGASWFLDKPLNDPDVEKLWQHVYLKNMKTKKIQNKNTAQTRTHGQDSSRKHISIGGSSKANNNLVTLPNAAPNPRKYPLDDGLVTRSPLTGRVIWTETLKCLFKRAVEQLGGINNADPLRILLFMKVPGLTRDNIASHLQAYKIENRDSVASTSGSQLTQQTSLIQPSGQGSTEATQQPWAHWPSSRPNLDIANASQSIDGTSNMLQSVNCGQQARDVVTGNVGSSTVGNACSSFLGSIPQYSSSSLNNSFTGSMQSITNAADSHGTQSSSSLNNTFTGLMQNITNAADSYGTQSSSSLNNTFTGLMQNITNAADSHGTQSSSSLNNTFTGLMQNITNAADSHGTQSLSGLNNTFTGLMQNIANAADSHGTQSLSGLNNTFTGLMQNITNAADSHGTQHSGPMVRGPVPELPNKPFVFGATGVSNLNRHYSHGQSSTSAPMETPSSAAKIPISTTTGFTTSQHSGPMVGGAIPETPNRPFVFGATGGSKLNLHYSHDQSSTSTTPVGTPTLAAEIPNTSTGYTTSQQSGPLQEFRSTPFVFGATGVPNLNRHFHGQSSTSAPVKTPTSAVELANTSQHSGPVLNKPFVFGATDVSHGQSSTGAHVETPNLAVETPNMATTGFTTSQVNEACGDGNSSDSEFDISKYLLDHLDSYDSEFDISDYLVDPDSQ